MNQLAKIMFVLGIALLLSATAHAASQLIVSNYGTDSSGCGTPDNPCRSISRAIQNAGSGDSIIVGPGRYDATIESGGGGYLVQVNKPLKISSRDGADVTAVDAGTNQLSCVSIEASGTVFGGKGKGFTLLGTSFHLCSGVVIGSGASHVTVAGNRAVALGFDGFETAGNTQSNQFIGNVAIACVNNGFTILGSSGTLQGNVALENQRVGFDCEATNLVFTGNVASGNGAIGMIAINFGNKTSRITGNSFVGNAFSGLDVGSDSGPFTITKNNMYGNDIFDNCGLINQNVPFDAPMNFFGAKSGPGPAPANGVCGTNTTTTPFATKEIKVTPIKP